MQAKLFVCTTLRTQGVSAAASNIASVPRTAGWRRSRSKLVDEYPNGLGHMQYRSGLILAKERGVRVWRGDILDDGRGEKMCLVGRDLVVGFLDELGFGS